MRFIIFFYKYLKTHYFLKDWFIYNDYYYIFDRYIQSLKKIL